MIGNLTRDPELKYIPSGTAVATFTLASNRVYKMASGEKKEETCFMRIVAWGRQAELCSEYLGKGSPCFVEGRLQSRSWETPEGQKRSTIEVVAQNIQFLGRGGGRTASEGAGADAQLEPVRNESQLAEGSGDVPEEGVEFPPADNIGEVPF